MEKAKIVYLSNRERDCVHYKLGYSDQNKI
jgi:hypothetical protein